MPRDPPDTLSEDHEALKQSVVALVLTLPADRQLRVMHGLAKRAEGASQLDTVAPSLRVLWQVTPDTARDLLARLMDAEA